MDLKKADLAGLLPIVGAVVTVFGYVLESQQRKQDNHEIAVEVAKILKEME